MRAADRPIYTEPIEDQQLSRTGNASAEGLGSLVEIASDFHV